MALHVGRARPAAGEQETPQPTRTRPSRRTLALTTYTLALSVWTWRAGLPNDTIQVFLWLWLGVIAWHADTEPRVHVRFLRDWWPPLLALVGYFYSRGIADDLHRHVSVEMPIQVDRWLFGGHLPTEVLQHRLCGVPCDPASDPRWYDLLLTTVYASHFLTGLTIAAVLWVRSRAEWVAWMRRLLVISYAALALYVAYPMAPPWWASQYGALPSDLPRLTGRGWEDIGIHRLNLLLGGVGNKVAAMPSLHAGIAFLVAAYGISRLRSRWRWLLAAYPVAMGFALVYYAEHYVVDVLAGWAVAVLVLVGCSQWERRTTAVAGGPAPPVREPAASQPP